MKRIYIFLIIIILGIVLFIWGQEYYEQRRVRVLYEVDHQQLLYECRKLIEEKKEGRWPKDQYVFNSSKDKNEIDQLPDIIKEIKPTYICIYDTNVYIEMVGGLAHFGIIAYDSDENALLNNVNKLLIPGMVYYDDAYSKNKDWDKHLESLRP